ncbi:MAG: S9 family peptidase [Actinobacteria bacterium]|nr:S9 family peptidase [Actinomycetota bacterium]
MRPEDLGRFSAVSDPCLHPDGTRIAFVVTRIDLDEDRYVRSIWLWDGDEARPFTHGPADVRPRWSPDGGRLAFLRASGEPKDPAQVAVMPASGGEAAVVTDFDLGAGEAEWSPDGTRLAVIGTTWEEEWAGLDDDERAKRPRRITSFGYRFDTQGWIHDRRSRLYLVDPEGGDPVGLTADGPWHHGGIAWHPDGTAVAVLGSRHDTRHLDSGVEVWEAAADGGGDRSISPLGMWMHVSYDPSGTPYVIGIEDLWAYPDVSVLHRLEDGAAVPAAPLLDRNLIAPTPAPAPAGPQWLADGSFLSTLEDAGRVRVVRFHPGGAVDDVAGGDRLITGVSPRPDGSAFAFTATTPTDPGALWWWEDGEERRLTGLNDEFSAGLTAPEHFVVEHDGVELDAWVFLPPGEEKVPALLNIHGGPATQYGFGFFDEFQVEVGAGYGVVACNPRGSSGKGSDFVRTPVGRWDEDEPPDLTDVLAVLDAALERHPRLDAERLGVMGGSYGGFLTARILAVTDRFRSAVPERGLYAFTSFAGTSDIGPRFARMYVGDAEPGDIGTLWAASPLSRAHRITTPSLIVHSESDYRCPIGQGEQLFTVLAANGVEVEMLRFPGSSHELSRGGKPALRKARFEAILDWHGRHL